METTRAISLLQPWATLLVSGQKKIETRSWKTLYRGPIAIHASKEFSTGAKLLCDMEPFRSALLAAGFESPEQLPMGKVLGTTKIVACFSTGSYQPVPHSNEACFGDYSLNRFCWITEESRKILTPYGCRGSLGIWKLPEPIQDDDLEAL